MPGMIDPGEDFSGGVDWDKHQRDADRKEELEQKQEGVKERERVLSSRVEKLEASMVTGTKANPFLTAMLKVSSFVKSIIVRIDLAFTRLDLSIRGEKIKQLTPPTTKPLYEEAEYSYSGDYRYSANDLARFADLELDDDLSLEDDFKDMPLEEKFVRKASDPHKNGGGFSAAQLTVIADLRNELLKFVKEHEDCSPDQIDSRIDHLISGDKDVMDALGPDRAKEVTDFFKSAFRPPSGETVEGRLGTIQSIISLYLEMS